MKDGVKKQRKCQRSALTLLAVRGENSLLSEGFSNKAPMMQKVFPGHVSDPITMFVLFPAAWVPWPPSWVSTRRRTGTLSRSLTRSRRWSSTRSSRWGTSQSMTSLCWSWKSRSSSTTMSSPSVSHRRTGNGRPEITSPFPAGVPFPVSDWGPVSISRRSFHA